MGSVLIAKCSCGFESGDLYLGGGFENFSEVCDVPCLCRNCNSLVVKNYLEKYSRCNNCNQLLLYYDNPVLRKSNKTKGIVFDWDNNSKGQFILTNSKYYCPKCKKFKMKFIWTGDWD